MDVQDIKRWGTQLKAILKKDLISTSRVKKYVFPVVIPPIALLLVFTLFTQTIHPVDLRCIL